MPKYITNGYFLSGGKSLEPGSEVELTAERAKQLGDKVKPVPAKAADKTTKSMKAKAEA